MTEVTDSVDSLRLLLIKKLNGPLVNGWNVDMYQYLKYSDNFAALGTDLAANECYEDAINFLSIAIIYHSRDHRLYFNRAYCFLEIDMNEEALKDIDVAIALKPNWSKAYFKKGQILANMNEFFTADKAYKTAYKFDNDEETRIQIRGNMYDALRYMGFDAIKSGYGAQYYFDIEEAADALNGGAFEVQLTLLRQEKKQKFFNKKNQKLTPITFY